MNDIYVIDSYAWIEYFRKSPDADKVEKYVESGKSVTPSIVLTEIVQKFKRENLDFKLAVSFIDVKTQTASLNKKIAVIAGEVGHERRKIHKDWPIADSIILATARELKAKIVTGDEHFRDLKEEAIMIK